MMTGFLVEYHRPSGDWSITEFPGERGRAEALRESFELERSRANTDYEIAVLATDSLETLKRTHSRYFNGSRREAGFSRAA